MKALSSSSLSASEPSAAALRRQLADSDDVTLARLFEAASTGGRGTMSDREADAQVARIEKILAAYGAPMHRGAERAADGETRIDWSNPLDELIAREKEAIEDALLEVMRGLFADRSDDLPPWFVAKVRELVFRQWEQYEATLLEMLFREGPHPLRVLRRLFIYAKYKRASLLWDFGYRPLGRLFLETHENMRLLAKMVFGNLPTAWRKGTVACARMAESARRRGGGKAEE